MVSTTQRAAQDVYYSFGKVLVPIRNMAWSEMVFDWQGRF
jgi:hypothetical protein